MHRLRNIVWTIMGAELGICVPTQTRLTVKKLKFYMIHTRKFLMTNMTIFPVWVLLAPLRLSELSYTVHTEHTMEECCCSSVLLVEG